MDRERSQRLKKGAVKSTPDADQEGDEKAFVGAPYYRAATAASKG